MFPYNRFVKVRAMKNFNGHELNDVLEVPMTLEVAHLIVDGYFELLDDPAWRLYRSSPQP